MKRRRTKPLNPGAPDKLPSAVQPEPPDREKGQPLDGTVGRRLGPAPSRKRVTHSLSFHCTMVRSSQQPEQKTVELLQWLLNISRDQIREGAA
jgi:hypothetical protein